MGKHRPAKRRDRRMGESPYARHGKRPYKYATPRVEVDTEMAGDAGPRKRLHVAAHNPTKLRREP